jgi:hypothetical protein
VNTTFEIAKKCPTCREAGEEVSVQPAPGGNGQVHIFACRNERCKDVDERWIVQTRPDGTIPVVERTPANKLYMPLSNDALASGQRMVEDAVQKDLRDTEGLKG